MTKQELEQRERDRAENWRDVIPFGIVAFLGYAIVGTIGWLLTH